MKNLEDVKLPTSSGEKKITAKSKGRILKCADLIRRGYSRIRVIETLMEEEGLKEKQCSHIYTATMDYLTPTEEEAAKIRYEVIATTRDLIEKCISDGDRQNALRAMEQLNKLNGLYIEKIDANVTGDVNFGFKFDTGVEDGEEDN